MSEQQNLMSRIGGWFKRTGRPGNGDLPLNHDANVIEPRSTFLRPWARRDAAIQQLQDGFSTLTDLMGSIRQSLDRQSKRQDELLSYLSNLPEALRSIPESSRIHTETLKAIHQQIQQQYTQQDKLGAILDKMSQSGGAQRQTLDELRDSVESLRQTDEAISSNLNGLGSALQSVSSNSSASAAVLEQMRDRIDTRDGQLERILHRQGTRFTTMLAIAIFLSITALVAVSAIGYLLLVKQ